MSLRLTDETIKIVEIFLDVVPGSQQDWINAVQLAAMASSRFPADIADRLLPGDTYPMLRQLVTAGWLEDRWTSSRQGATQSKVYRLPPERAAEARRAIARYEAAERERFRSAFRPGASTA